VPQVWMQDYSGWCLETDNTNAFGFRQACPQPAGTGTPWTEKAVGNKLCQAEVQEDIADFCGSSEIENSHWDQSQSHTDNEVVASSRHENPQLARRGSSARKIPISDEKRACEIIEIARLALNQNRFDPTIWELSHQNKHTSVNVQNALDIAAHKGWESGSEADWGDAWALVMCLQGRVRQLYESPAANFVLSKIFEVMPTSVVSCLAEELCESIIDAAKHRFGCRCVVRLVRYHAKEGAHDDNVTKVVESLVGAVDPLSHAQFGTHVVQELIEAGLPEHRRKIIRSLQGGLHRMAKNKFATRVVEKLISKSCASDVYAMIDELLNGRDSMRQMVILMNHEFGARVVKALLNSAQARRAAECICKVSSDSLTSRVSRGLLQDAQSIVSRTGFRGPHR